MTGGRDDGPLGFGGEDDAPAGDAAERGAEPGPPAQDPSRPPHRPRAAQLLAAGDEPTAPPTMRRSGLPRGFSRYGWFFGVALVLLLALVTVNSLNTDGVGSRGLPAGTPAPPFAAPLAASDLDGDVNVATKADQGGAGNVPACSIRRPDVLNLCTLTERGPVVLAFFAIRGGSCVDQLAVLEAVRPKHPRVQFAAISIRGDRGDLRDLVRRQDWGFPVGYDRDGVLANLYGVAVCPQITFLERGGKTFDTVLGEIGADALDRRITALERGRPAAGTATTTSG